MGIGVDGLPQHILKSKVLTGNHLGQLGNTEVIPSADEISQYKSSGAILEAFKEYGESLENPYQHLAVKLLDIGKVDEAWKVLLSEL